MLKTGTGERSRAISKWLRVVSRACCCGRTSGRQSFASFSRIVTIRSAALIL